MKIGLMGVWSAGERWIYALRDWSKPGCRHRLTAPVTVGSWTVRGCADCDALFARR